MIHVKIRLQKVLFVTALATVLNSHSAVTAELQVIGAGYPRTGTSSLREALKILGYKTYHMTEVMQEGHVEEWTAYFQGRRKNISETAQKVYEDLGYTAAVDAPTCNVWKELALLYPQAKIILSERSSAEQWWESASQTVLIPTVTTTFLFTFVPFWKSFATLLGELWYDMFLLDRPRDVTPQDKEQCIAAYHRNSAEVKEFQDASEDNKARVLIFQAAQGWEPLCHFLGKPIPDVPFPNINNRKAFHKHMLKTFLIWFVPVVCAIIAFLCGPLEQRETLKAAPEVAQKKD